MREHMIIIDGSSLLSTQYYGNMPSKIKFENDESKRAEMYSLLMQTKEGVYTNGIYGFFRYLFNMIRTNEPSHLAIAWDVGRNTFRREISADYKGTRKETPQPLKQQFILCQQLCEKMGIVQFKDERYEADDFCGTLAKRFEKSIPIRILTKDRDYFQLISDNTAVYLLMSSGEKANEMFDKHGMDHRKYCFPDKSFRFDRDILYSEYGYTPDVAVTVKALAGDPSDNIKGVPGVGEDVAVKLANKYKTIDALYAAIENLDKNGIKAIKEEWKTIGINRAPLTALTKTDDSILVGKNAAKVSEQLGTIKTDIDIDSYFFFGAGLDEFRVKIDSETARNALLELEIKTIDTSI